MNRTPGIRVLIAVSSAILLATLLAVPTTARAADLVFTIRGGGYGHGIGLSQWGSQGFALQGYTYDRIIKRYFQGGVTIAQATANPVVRVNLDKAAAARTSWTVRAVDAALTISWGSPAVTVTLPANADYTMTYTGAFIRVKDAAGTTLHTTSTPLLLDPVGEDALFQIKDASGPVLHSSYPNGYPYMRWRGRLQLSGSGVDGLLAVNLVSLKHYLYGVVPRESPASWHVEALKSQAVVAHSYAKAKIDPDDNGLTGSVLRCTTADQVYGGHSRMSNGTVVKHEDSRTNLAVDTTLGKLVKYGSTIVQTFFFSSSGGHTANIEDVWGSAATPRPYYTGVPDPYEAVAGSPHLSWEVKKTGSQIGTALGSSSPVVGVTVERGVSGYPKKTTFRFADGRTTARTSDQVRVALGLKSPNFAISGFPMERVQGPDRYATAAAVSRQAFSGTAPTVVLASGQDYPDALAGSALAGASKGSLLLSAKTYLPDSTRAELKRLAPAKVYIMGSSAALSTAVDSAVKSVLTTATVERVQGPNRYDTAVEAARRVAAIAPLSKVIVVSGTAWPDAAAASALAYAKSYPVLLMRPAEVGDSASVFLAQYRPETALFVGGANIVSDSIKSAVGKLTGKATLRLSGPNRYETAAAVARHSVTVEGFGVTEAYLATGLNYADALTGGMLAGLQRQPLLFMQRDACPGGTAAFLRERKATLTKLWVFGSAAAISETGMSSLDSVMMQ